MSTNQSVVHTRRRAAHSGRRPLCSSRSAATAWASTWSTSRSRRTRAVGAREGRRSRCLTRSPRLGRRAPIRRRSRCLSLGVCRTALSSSAARIWSVLSGSPRAGSSPANFTSRWTPSSAARVRNRSAASPSRSPRSPAGGCGHGVAVGRVAVPGLERDHLAHLLPNEVAGEGDALV
jgi:hypothetical protein